MRENKPEREKGKAPPDYVPAIFGWVSQEQQAESAREIAAFTEKLESKTFKRK